MCKIKVLAPQSVRVRREGDKCSKGDDEESGLKRRKEIISVEAFLWLFFNFKGSVIFQCCLSSITELKKIQGGELNFSISKLIWWNLTEATSRPLSLAYCASAVRCRTDGISDQCRVMT